MVAIKENGDPAGEERRSVVARNVGFVTSYCAVCPVKGSVDSFTLGYTVTHELGQSPTVVSVEWYFGSFGFTHASTIHSKMNDVVGQWTTDVFCRSCVWSLA